MPKRGQNIYKRKDGRWEGRYIKFRIDGKAQYGYVYAKTYKDVKEKLNDKINMYKTAEITSVKLSISFKSVSEEWFDDCAVRLKESSTAKYRNILDNYIYPQFADMDIKAFTINIVSDFCSSLLNNGGAKNRGLSPKTVSSVLSVLKSIFEYISKNKNINMPTLDDIIIKQSFKPMKVLTVSEQYKLNQYLVRNLTLANIGILICMYTGIRIGEICALKWKNISLAEHSILIDSTMQRLQLHNSDSNKTKIHISKPKSNCSIRRVPIPDNIYDILKEIKQCDECYILTGSSDSFLEPRVMQYKFKNIIKTCGIDNINFHSLRHTFATRCVEVGVDVKSLSEILGHASVNVTLNRYVHPSMEQKLKNVNMMSKLIAVN